MREISRGNDNLGEKKKDKGMRREIRTWVIRNGGRSNEKREGHN